MKNYIGAIKLFLWCITHKGYHDKIHTPKHAWEIARCVWLD